MPTRAVDRSTTDDVDDPTGEVAGSLQFMTRDEHGGPGIRSLPQHTIEFVTAVGIESGMGLVEQPQFGAPGDEACERHPTSLAGRQRADGDVGEAPVDGESDHRRSHFVTRRTHGGPPERDVLLDREVAVQPVVVSEQADPRPHQVGVGAEVEPEHASRPALDREQRRAQPQHTRLSGTVRTSEQDDLAPLDPQRRPREHGERSRHGDHVAEFDDCGRDRAIGGLGRERWDWHRQNGSRRWWAPISGPTPRYAPIGDPDDCRRSDIVPAVPAPSRRHHAVTSRVAGEVGFDVGPQFRSLRQRYIAATRRSKRVSKWDLSPDPRDWRYVVGMIGRILISIGILMFGFVAYQLWGTGLETARAQSSLGDRFEAVVTESEPGDTDVTVVPATTAPDSAASDDADAGAASVDEPDEGVPSADDRSATPLAVDQDIPEIVPGQAFARLELPTIGKDLFVVPGVGVEDLKKGPGHYPDTPLPGQLGNASIAGHRTTFGEPFIDVDQLAPGDQMIVTMITGDRFVYEVTGTQIVTAADYWVVTTTDPTVAELTLTSCHPKYSARERIVVKGILVPELSDPVGFPEFYAQDATAPVPIPGDDPTLEEPVPDTTISDETPTSVPDEVDVGGSNGATPGGGTPDDGTTDGGASAVGAAADGAADAFSRGWFDDRAAWPQIALWGSALTIISILAYRLSRRTRHDTIGFAAGIVPFLVSLYFFFQNVNRLLPPGL